MTDFVRVSDLALADAFRAELRAVRSGLSVVGLLSKCGCRSLRRHGLLVHGPRGTVLTRYGSELLRGLEASPP